ncbi:MAG: hypothetical protein A4E66_00479 [Syntrophus sp. PtaB.Bin001]|nr:MAG: hypothetical protein A4E66_00479 [Syntrophus sp. PtaB.Bin001]
MAKERRYKTNKSVIVEQNKLTQEWGHLGQLTDTTPGWIQVNPLYQELEENACLYVLPRYQSKINEACAMDLRDYKQSAAKRLRNEKLSEAMRAAYTFFKKPLEEAAQRIPAAKAAILRESEYEVPKDQTKALLNELRFQEIRRLIRDCDPHHRLDYIKKGGLPYLQALQTAPDQIIDPDKLITLRREYAFAEDESFREMESDAEALYKFTRQRAAEVKATMIAMQIDAAKETGFTELADDPLPLEEHILTFPPTNESEAAMIERRIINENRRKEQDARTAKFNEDHPGLNFPASDE